MSFLSEGRRSWGRKSSQQTNENMTPLTLGGGGLCLDPDDLLALPTHWSLGPGQRHM